MGIVKQFPCLRASCSVSGGRRGLEGERVTGWTGWGSRKREEQGWLAEGSAPLPATCFSTGAAVFSRLEHSHGSVIILTGCRENTHTLEELRRCASNHVARLSTFLPLSSLFLFRAPGSHQPLRTTHKPGRHLKVLGRATSTDDMWSTRTAFC